VSRGKRFDPRPGTPPWVSRLRDAAKSTPDEAASTGGVLHLASAVSPAPASFEPPAGEVAPSKPVEAASRYVVFSVGPERYAVAVDSVLEVRPSPRCTPLPNVAGFVRGVAHVRGEMVIVLDLADLLGVPSADDSMRERVLLVKPPGQDQVGALLADEVLDLALLSERTLSEGTVRGPVAPYLRESCRFEGQAIRVLDVAGLFTSGVIREMARGKVSS